MLSDTIMALIRAEPGIARSAFWPAIAFLRGRL